jgi:hypothetical protein
MAKKKIQRIIEPDLAEALEERDQAIEELQRAEKKIARLNNPGGYNANLLGRCFQDIDYDDEPMDNFGKIVKIINPAKLLVVRVMDSKTSKPVIKFDTMGMTDLIDMEVTPQVFHDALQNAQRTIEEAVK